MELSIEQRDSLDLLASLGCDVTFVQFDEVFRSYTYFHLNSLYPDLLGSPMQIHVEESVDGDKCLSELYFKIEVEFKEYDYSGIDFNKLVHAIDWIKANKCLLSSLLYFKGGVNANSATTR